MLERDPVWLVMSGGGEWGLMGTVRRAVWVCAVYLRWVAGAGYDPVEAIERYRSRIHLLHVKDIASAERVPGRLVTDSRTTVIGGGTVDWPAVFRAVRRAPVHSYFVEQEEPFSEPPLEALAKSIAYLRGLSV